MEDYKKKYKDALNKAKDMLKHNEVSQEDMEYLFPELKESENEEKPNGGIVLEDFDEGNGFYKVNLSYLSKEQVEEIENIVKKWNPEPVESEDERIRKNLIELFHDTVSNDEIFSDYGLDKTEVLAWLEKQGEQKPAEWSEEDERLLSKLQTYVDLECFDRECNGQDLINWLKSLRHQNTWKPSEEQMKYLHKYAEQNNYDGTILTGLYNDLKQFKQY